MSRKHLFLAILCGIIWGFASIYWHMLSHVNAVLVLCCRIIFAAIFAFIVINFQKNIALLKRNFMDKDKIKYIIPAVVIISFNWGL